MILKKIKVLKSEVALQQLRRSIQLFNIGDFISSVTLAGAANEVLGEFAFRRKGYNSVDEDKSFWDSFAGNFKRDKPSRGKIKKSNNEVKNSLKHHDSDEDLKVEAYFKFEAQLQIDAAIHNYWIAFDNPPKDRIINKYVRREWT